MNYGKVSWWYLWEIHGRIRTNSAERHPQDSHIWVGFKLMDKPSPMVGLWHWVIPTLFYDAPENPSLKIWERCILKATQNSVIKSYEIGYINHMNS